MLTHWMLRIEMFDRTTEGEVMIALLKAIAPKQVVQIVEDEVAFNLTKAKSWLYIFIPKLGRITLTATLMLMDHNLIT